MLGGTLVTLSGSCFEATDTVECVFGEISTPGLYLNRYNVMCISPALTAIGNVELRLKVNNSIIERSGYFYSGTLK